VAGLTSSGVVLITLYALGKYLSVIPKAALASIVVVNLRGMFRQVLQLPPIWKYSKIDGLVWILTFLITGKYEKNFTLFGKLIMNFYFGQSERRTKHFQKIISPKNSLPYF
jgi:hypothetical protein